MAVRGAVANQPLRAQEEEVFPSNFILRHCSLSTLVLLLRQTNQLNLPSVSGATKTPPTQSLTLD